MTLFMVTKSTTRAKGKQRQGSDMISKKREGKNMSWFSEKEQRYLMIQRHCCMLEMHFNLSLLIIASSNQFIQSFFLKPKSENNRKGKTL